MRRSKNESTEEDKVISWGRGKGSKPDCLRQVKNENEWGAGKLAPFSLGVLLDTGYKKEGVGKTEEQKRE